MLVVLKYKWNNRLVLFLPLRELSDSHFIYYVFIADKLGFNVANKIVRVFVDTFCLFYSKKSNHTFHKLDDIYKSVGKSTINKSQSNKTQNFTHGLDKLHLHS